MKTGWLPKRPMRESVLGSACRVIRDVSQSVYKKVWVKFTGRQNPSSPHLVPR
jgi:hypothetical protein